MVASLPAAVFGGHGLAARSERISVLLADDTPMGCQLLKNALTRSRFRFEILKCATARSEIIHFMTSHHVDVAVVSESLRDGPLMGFQVLSELRASSPKTRGIILLKSAPHDLVVDAFRGGAKGVLCKAESVQALCKCIHAVHRGQIWANSNQLHFILEALVKTAPSRPSRMISSERLFLLAKREDEVASLVAEGLTNREIAQALSLSVHTVSNYLFRIYEKLGISSRVELVLYVLRQREQH